MSNIEEKLIGHLENCLSKSNNSESKLIDDILNLDGMSGKKTRHFYNNLLEIDDARYLEIGTWKGSSVCSAMYGNKARVFCIDNWSEFQGPKEDFINNFNLYKGENDAQFIEMDCFDVNISNLPKFNIYLYDGRHLDEDQYRALTHYIDVMDDVFIYIVDDWNDQFVQSGTKRALQDLNLDILFEHEILTTTDGSHVDVPTGKENWWNGCYILLLKKPI
jgi:hypothetical protein